MTDPAPTPDGVLGTPPKPHRSALIRLPSTPIPPYRTLTAVIVGVLAIVAIAWLAGIYQLSDVVVGLCVAGIPGTVWGQAWKAKNQHTAQSPGIATSESTP